MLILLVLAMRSLASVPDLQGFERFHSRDPMVFKTPDLAAHDFADLAGSNLHRQRLLLI